jgi:hypothetical protein
MYFLCTAVISEGGGEDINQFGYTFQQMTDSINIATSPTHVLTLRPKLTFNGIANRARVSFIDVEVYNAGNQPVRWDLVIGQALTGATTLVDVNLPTGTATDVIELVVKGSFALNLPAYWTPLPSNDTYNGAVRNHIVVSCINGTTSSEEVFYSLENLLT